MKIKKNELFKLNNPKLETVERSILMAIYKKREGNYKDFYFKEEKEFVKFLNALINKKLIVRNVLIIHKDEINIEDFSYVEDNDFPINNYYKVIKFLKDNVVGLIGLSISIIALFIKG